MYLNSLIKSIIFPSQKLSLRISQPQPIIKKDYDPFSEINPIVSNQEKLKENSKIVEQFAEELANKKYKKITFLTGAGISVSAGIPDFRSPETGLYAQIKKEYNISEPTKIFSIKYYKENPLPFIQVIKDFFSRDYEPTYAHKLINTLNKRKQLLVNITQNIDGLELKEGVQPQKVVQAHGHMRSAHCINCNHTVSIDTFIENCKHLKTTNCPKCQNLVKPKIVRK